MHFKYQKAFIQGIKDAWNDKEPTVGNYKQIAEKKKYLEGYAVALHDIDKYYQQQKLDYPE